MVEPSRWFADIDEDAPEASIYRWAAFVQVAGGCHQLGGVWFKSEGDCLDFIRDEGLS
jgi:hypothetical protein